MAGKTPLVTPLCDDVMKRREIISTKPRWKRVSVCIFLSFGLFMLLCVPPALHNIYFIRLRHDIAYMCRRCHYKHQRAKPNKTNYRIPRFFPRCVPWRKIVVIAHHQYVVFSLCITAAAAIAIPVIIVLLLLIILILAAVWAYRR